VSLELFADRQMAALLAAKRARRCKKKKATVLDRGLWRWSRHPNYAGEMLWWWGVWFCSTSSKAPVWVVVGPCGLTLLFNWISVQLLEERQLGNKGKAYEDYQCRVPSALLPIPPAMTRWLSSART
jgi:steroid 5-alpha reductase family enzyme